MNLVIVVGISILAVAGCCGILAVFDWVVGGGW